MRLNPEIPEIRGRAVDRIVEGPGEQKKWAKYWWSERKTSCDVRHTLSRTSGGTTWPAGLIKIVGFRRRQRMKLINNTSHAGAKRRQLGTRSDEDWELLKLKSSDVWWKTAKKAFMVSILLL
ncbi:hypothetical protein K438DRAFT_1768485 [Mycena galopus ATCC 62051]|nr:hypothetical protein K438DRAFT_1768485 [Mycena galopus ATCC 62051]